MNSTLVTFVIIVLLLILIKYNTNNLQFMTGNMEIYETFVNPPPNFICEKDDIACILTYQNYNKECQDIFSTWKKFQNLNHGKKMGGKNVKILAIDTTQNANLSIGGNVDGPKVSLVTRYNIQNYDGRLNLENLQKFLNQHI